MRVDPLTALRMEAALAGRAVAAHTHRTIDLMPHALLLAGIPIAGDDASLHAVAYRTLCRRGRPPQVRSVPDPRSRDAKRALYGVLARDFELYLSVCERRGVTPQIVVTSPAGLALWTNVADDYRFFTDEPALAAFATAMSYFTGRSELAGQQAVAIMTEVLAHHFVTPLQPAQERHLGAVLACHDVPPGEDVYACVRAAEQIPMGASTTPDFEEDVLAPRIARYHGARLRGATRATLAVLGGDVECMLAPIVVGMIDALDAGVALLERANLPQLPEVEWWAEDEHRAFLTFRRYVARGGRIPRRDRAARAVRELTRREERQAMLAASIACHDVFGRFRAVWLGEAVEGEVRAVRREQVPSARRRVTVVDLATDQPMLRLRRADDVVGRDEPRYVAHVLAVGRDTCPGPDRGLHVRLQLSGGSRRPGPPPVGSIVAFLRERPDRWREQRMLAQLAPKLGRLSWMQMLGAIPVRRPRGIAPANPLAVLEAFR